MITVKNCQTLDEYSEKTVRGAMGCDVLKTNYNYSTEYDDTFFLIENSSVSEREMVDYAHRKSWGGGDRGREPGRIGGGRGTGGGREKGGKGEI